MFVMKSTPNQVTVHSSLHNYVHSNCSWSWTQIQEFLLPYTFTLHVHVRNPHCYLTHNSTLHTNMDSDSVPCVLQITAAWFVHTLYILPHSFCMDRYKTLYSGLDYGLKFGLDWTVDSVLALPFKEDWMLDFPMSRGLAYSINTCAAFSKTSWWV